MYHYLVTVLVGSVSLELDVFACGHEAAIERIKETLGEDVQVTRTVYADKPDGPSLTR